MLAFFPIQTFVNSNRCNITPSNAKGQSHVSRNELGRYVTVDDGGNYVTERSHKDKKNNNNSSQRELGPPVNGVTKASRKLLKKLYLRFCEVQIVHSNANFKKNISLTTGV